MTRFADPLRSLSTAGVEFILIEGPWSRRLLPASLIFGGTSGLPFRWDFFTLRECLVLDLPALIQTKRAAGRPKDLEAIAELEMLLQRREIQ